MRGIQAHGKDRRRDGGNTGIGGATVKPSAAEGAPVFITGGRQAEIDMAAHAVGLDAIGIQADLTQMTEDGSLQNRHAVRQCRWRFSSSAR